MEEMKNKNRVGVNYFDLTQLFPKRSENINVEIVFDFTILIISKRFSESKLIVGIRHLHSTLPRPACSAQLRYR